MNCQKCKKETPDSSTFCLHCGEKQIFLKGWWRVKTDGDCEGRTRKDLGLHYGYLDEIADNLSGECEGCLYFAFLSQDFKYNPPKRSKVPIYVFDVDAKVLEKEFKALNRPSKLKLDKNHNMFLYFPWNTD
jgi:hypothetical protein